MKVELFIRATEDGKKVILTTEMKEALHHLEQAARKIESPKTLVVELYTKKHRPESANDVTHGNN